MLDINFYSTNFVCLSIDCGHFCNLRVGKPRPLFIIVMLSSVFKSRSELTRRNHHLHIMITKDNRYHHTTTVSIGTKTKITLRYCNVVNKKRKIKHIFKI